MQQKKINIEARTFSSFSWKTKKKLIYNREEMKNTHTQQKKRHVHGIYIISVIII
jgi:hypothetical protein